MGPSWEAEQGWDKARHSLGTPLLPAQTVHGVCTSGVGSSPLAVTPWWATTLSPTLLGHQEEPRGTTRGVEHRIQALGAGIGHHARGRGALAAKGAQHRPPCPLCMICPALHGATRDMGTSTGVGTERTGPGRRRALTSGTAWPQPRGSSCRRSLPGAVSSELGAHRAPRRGNEG